MNGNAGRGKMTGAVNLHFVGRLHLAELTTTTTTTTTTTAEDTGNKGKMTGAVHLKSMGLYLATTPTRRTKRVMDILQSRSK
jgi:hypothetical protein